ncbi:MAG TPA: Holliday junction branch migration protein RuvA [Patescibacteria group bacterium]|jgi:Holliday junction DNA helicase RuvA|nr:Holliday junction branch migration protein RuvA [Patescibacteria group bacterium]
MAAVPVVQGLTKLTCVTINHMIAYLKGQIQQKTLQYIVLVNAGVGYKIFTTPEVLDLPLGSETELYIYHKSGDDGQTLFGMPDFDSLQFFEMLVSVTGVGPKMALNIVSSSKIELLQQAILNADTEIFTRMSGVGEKTAERIILELKSKIDSGGLLTGSNVAGSEVYDALSGLGYNPREIRETLPQLDATEDTATQLKHALKILSRN